MLDLFIIYYLMGAMACFPKVVANCPENYIEEEGMAFFIFRGFVVALLFWWALPAKLVYRVIRWLFGAPVQSAQA